MDKIKQYRKLCSLETPLEPYLRPSPTQILYTKKKIRLKLIKKGGDDKKMTIIYMDKFE